MGRSARNVERRLPKSAEREYCFLPDCNSTSGSFDYSGALLNSYFDTAKSPWRILSIYRNRWEYSIFTRGGSAFGMGKLRCGWEPMRWCWCPSIRPAGVRRGFNQRRFLRPIENGWDPLFCPRCWCAGRRPRLKSS